MAFLRPVPMVKVGLIGLKEDRERIVALLHDSGVVQVEPLRKEAAAIWAAEPAAEPQRRVSEELLRFRSLKAAMPARAPREPPRPYPSLASVLEATRQVPIDEEVSRLKSEEDRLKTERTRLGELAGLLAAHAYYSEPLHLLQTRRLLAYFGTATPSAFRSLREQVERLAPAAFVTDGGAEELRVLLAVPTEQADAIGRLAQSAGVRLTPVPALDGPIAEELPRAREALARVQARLAEIADRLGAIAAEWHPTVASIEEALAIENRKFEAWSRMGAGERGFAVEGWVPKRALPSVEEALARATGDRAELFVLPTREEPPTLMDNPPGVRWFEFFIRFYAIPKASEFDPTWIFALAFPIFFGFMLGDAGYALVILGFCVWMIAGFPGGGRIPRFLKGIPMLIMGPRTMQSLARTILPGAIIGVGVGALFNGWFGFHLPFYTAPFDPIAGVGKLLLLGGYFGLIMVVAGFFLGILKALAHHHPREALARFAGIILAVSLAGLGLMLIHGTLVLGAPTSLDALLSLLGIIGIVGAILLLLAAEGGQGIMGVPEVLSHILSYSRLVGILLSAVILASIVNIGYSGLVNYPTSSVAAHAGFVLLGVFILIAGQIFVLILAVFEPGIQGARLIFVEHFSKFYEGNGRPFAPFSSPRTYTRPATIDDEPRTLIVGPGARRDPARPSP